MQAPVRAHERAQTYARGHKRARAPAANTVLVMLNGRAIYGRSDYGAVFGAGGNLVVDPAGHVTCNIGTTYTPGPTTGATISREARVAVVAMEVWQLADA